MMTDEYDNNTTLVAEEDQLLEMSVGARENMTAPVGLQSAFLTHEERLKKEQLVKQLK